MINAIADCENASIRKDIYDKINDIDNQILTINNELVKEEKKNVKISTQLVRFYFHSFKAGNVNDQSYRKRLISTFVNKVFVFDDKVRIYFNIKDDSVDVDISTVFKGMCSNKDLCSPPNEH